MRPFFRLAHAFPPLPRNRALFARGATCKNRHRALLQTWADRGGKKRMSHEGHSEALASLARRSDLPVRVHGALVGLQKRTAAYFDSAIARTIDELERELFKLAEQSGSNAAQQTCFEGLRRLKLGRAGVAPLFLQHTESQLAQMRSTQEKAPVVAIRSTANSVPDLELVGVAAQEEELALQEVGGKAEVRNSQSLYAFARRLGVLGAAPVWPNETLPLGPAQIAQAFHHALQRLDLELDQRILAYRLFDRTAMLAVGPFYEGLNAYLIAERILPHLQIQNVQRRGAAAGAARDNFAEAPAPETQPPPPQHATSPRAASANLHNAEDPELFKTLRNLLSERRHRDGEIEPRLDDQVFQATSSDLQSLLGALQHTPVRGSPADYDGEHFKNTLQVKLRRMGPVGQPLRLGDEDSDTVDLIGMLFGYINESMQENTAARGLLNKLHVPMMRVALSDKTFFTRRDHPARELLNSIAETASRWVDDTDNDPELVRKMELVVDHVGTDFDGDIGVFEKLLSDVSGHMQQLARRAEVVERRHIDAAKGRDRLDIARDAARKAITRVIQRSTPMPVVRSLLEDAWVDALALSALRDGEAGAEFKHRVDVAEKLARITPQSAPTAAYPALRADLDAGLRQVGLHDDDVHHLLDNLLPAPGAEAAVTPDALRRIDDSLKAKTRLGVSANAPPTPPAPAPVKLNAAERAMLERLYKVAFGSWFEFATNPPGKFVRRKLAWFSTVTGHCLFVNQRGARANEQTLEQLARDMVRGQARLAGTEHTSLIDRAWKAITETLRPLTNRAAATGS